MEFAIKGLSQSDHYRDEALRSLLEWQAWRYCFGGRQVPHGARGHVPYFVLVADRHTLPWSAMVLDPEDEEWQHSNRTNWRGLGLADPIKNVEVRTFQISP